jgi:hypothetical protein
LIFAVKDDTIAIKVAIIEIRKGKFAPLPWIPDD